MNKQEQIFDLFRDRLNDGHEPDRAMYLAVDAWDNFDKHMQKVDAHEKSSVADAGIGEGDLVYSEDEAIIGRVERISSHSAVIECDDCFVTRDANELVLIKKAGEE